MIISGTETALSHCILKRVGAKEKSEWEKSAMSHTVGWVANIYWYLL